MKAAVFHGPGDVRFEEVATPTLNDGEVLIRVHACGICGSDLHTYRHGLFPGLGLQAETGRILGHEFSGEIVETKGDVQTVKVGDRVTTVGMGGNAEYFRVAAQMVPSISRIPDHVSFEEAATTEPLATSLHAVNLAAPTDEQTLVVMGAGIIGLGVVQGIKALCSARTIVVDMSDRRLEMATQLGAELTFNAGREDAVSKITEITGAGQLSLVDAPVSRVDSVFDCAGVTRDFSGTSVLEQALSLVTQNGKVIVVAIFEKALQIDHNVIVRKGVQLLGSWAWTQQEFAQSLELISSAKVDRKPLITHEFSLQDASEAYETQLNAAEAIKVVLKP
jgi:2-desacetyl-2-hydroxyethyl bacteriochlorophyllide A dehydrogenase|tara:strand:+ start:1207 stop:2211 length:1005 start_codon:yes stop_codon:yes gene_type:complete